MPSDGTPLLQLIGNTPLVPLQRIPSADYARILGKLEARNPSGSIKDRAALAMIEDAEASGRLQPGAMLVEATSGNTGLALAMIGAAKGYRLTITAPDTVPLDRRRLLTRLGTQLQITLAPLGMEGATHTAQELVRRHPDYLFLSQFTNPAVVEVHRRTTAQEILHDVQGEVDAFVAGVGTGGTITGVGEVLKQHNPKTHIVAVEPAGSPLLSQGRVGQHAIPGLGAGFVPPLLNRDIVDEIIGVSDDDAKATMHRLGAEEGLLVGLSSGACVLAALQVARRLGPGKTVVCILADTGERYLNLPA